KRCRHIAPNSDLAESEIEPTHKSRKLALNQNDRGSIENQHLSPQGPVAREADSSAMALPSFPGTDRFVGDLNPEAFIREKLDEPTGHRLRDRVGLWISSSPSQDHTQHGWDHQRRSVGSNSLSISSPPPPKSREAIETLLNRRYASAMQSCGRLPKSTRDALSAIYFSKINHIIPLVEINSFVKHEHDGSVSIFLERAICLVAAKDIDATPYLRLVAEGPIVSSRQFCTNIYNGLTVAMDAELEPDRLTRIRILSLMALHCEGHEGAEAASLHLCVAIHQAQTVGLHLDRPAGTEALQTNPFWALWTLDKMHASIGGRPVLIADRDIGLQKPSSHTSGAFGVWLAISDLLATVISYYRPSAATTSGWEEAFPAFEDIIGDDIPVEPDLPTLGILELYYHCVAILSCRHKLTETLDSTKASTIRQGLAAIRIHSIVASECAGKLPPLPIVPYAIALSMGVSYRQLRSSKLITHFNRAKASLEACCSLLEELSPQWYSAEAMARLGQRALQHVNYDHSRHTQPKSLSVAQSAPPPPPPPAPAPAPLGETSIDSEPVRLSDDTGLASNQIGSVIPVDVSDANISINDSLPSMDDLGTTTDGFADIDTLFGEFLDLSLPTNFWDPIFAEAEPKLDRDI
ncbi:transcriptional regulator family: Fungal Specific TF, partial [Penicillium angulare]